MVLCQFEDLPNEVWLSIFGYLSTVDQLFSFYNLNICLNSLLKNNGTKIDLSNCGRSQFIFAYESVLNRIHNLFDLKLLLKHMETSIDSFFIKLKLHNLDILLQSLTLVNGTDQSIDTVVQHLKPLINLHSLTIIYDLLEATVNSVGKIMNTVMASLTLLKIEHIGEDAQYFHPINFIETCSTILN